MDIELACWCNSSVDAAMLLVVVAATGVVDVEEQDGDGATGFSCCTSNLGGGRPNK
jgi:hypothetical protein